MKAIASGNSRSAPRGTHTPSLRFSSLMNRTRAAVTHGDVTHGTPVALTLIAILLIVLLLILP